MFDENMLSIKVVLMILVMIKRNVVRMVVSVVMVVRGKWFSRVNVMCFILVCVSVSNWFWLLSVL